MAVAVRFDRVSKRFRRGQIHDSLRDLISAGLRRLAGRGAASDDDSEFWALRDVEFEAASGEALGIIGPNGAGKSTALKLLAGILRPDGGRIEVNGRLAALIEVGAGMHGDLTGLENIFLNGAIMGMSRAEIRGKLDAIIAFSGLERFVDTPVKRYSTGMQARLGFATAAHVSPDILLVDEVLSVGDAAFRHRCEQRMSELVRNGACLIFVTHNLEQMRKICKRTLVLNQGACTYLGEPAAAVEHYLKASMSASGAVGYSDQPQDAHSTVEVLGVTFRSADGVNLTCADPHEPLNIEVRLQVKVPVERLAVQVAFRHVGGELFISMNSQQQGKTYAVEPGAQRVSLLLPALPVCSGTYYAQIRLWDMEDCRLLGETPFAYTLQVEDGGRATGMLALPHTWSEMKPESPAAPTTHSASDAAVIAAAPV